MSSFPFLKLPQLAQKVVVGQIGFISVIKLPMLSKKVENILKQVKIAVGRFDYKFDSGSFSFAIVTSSGTLFLSPTISCQGLEENWNVNGNNLKVFKDANYSNSDFPSMFVKSQNDTDESKLDILEKLTKYLLNFLNVKNFELTIEKNIGILNLFIWKYTTRFNAIYCGEHFRPIDLTPDELKLILENLTIGFLSLNVQIKNDPNFKYHPQNQGLSKIRKIEILKSNWLDYDNLLKLANESITCFIPSKFSGKLNGILKKWMSGTNENLDELTFLVKGGGEFVKEKVLKGVNAIPSTFTKDELGKRSISNPDFALPRLYTAMDIQREHDGCQATLVLTGRFIRLCVWNEKRLREIGRV